MTSEINVNQDIVLLPSTTRSGGGTVNSADQDNPYWIGCVLYLNITQSSGTGGLKLLLEYKDPASGNYVPIWSSLVYTATGPYALIVHPNGNLDHGSGESTPAALPRTWRIQISPQDASAYTYSVGCSLLK